MAAGGIHDQIGGGFARYSVDDVWLVPHFEKMLYDNALLARAYLHGFQALGHERWRLVCERTLDWMLAEMRGAEGGFYSALDADSEGVEGRFYVWSAAEIRELLEAAGLGETAEALIAYYGVTEGGNFEGANILHLPGGAGAEPPPRLDEARRALYEARAERVWPGLDDKRLRSWNALAIAALADAGAVLGRDDYLDAARDCADFVWERMRDADGRLLRTCKDGEAKLNAYLEDHAYLLEALLTLYEATFEVRWFDAARETAERMIERFADPERGGFFTTSNDHETADRAPQGHRRPPDPFRQLRRRARAAAAGGAHRRALIRAPRGLRLPPLRPRRRAPPAGRRPPAAGDRLPPRPGQGGRAGLPAGADGLGELAAVVRSALSPPPRPRRRRGGNRAARADAAAHRGRGPNRRLRVRELRLPQPVTEPAELADALDG